MYELKTLENGLRIACHTMPNIESLGLGIWVGVGARFEEEKISGISHFLEHVVFKGTKTMSCNDIKEAIEGVGGSLNGFTTEEVTCFLVKVRGKFLRRAVDVLSDMVLNPKLRQEDIDTERSVILEEIKMYLDLPAYKASEMFGRLLWNTHPLGMPIIGTFESIKNINRQDLLDFKGRFYKPNNVIISAAGSAKMEELSNIASGIFSKRNKARLNGFRPAPRETGARRFNWLFKETEQTRLILGFKGLKRDHPDRHILSLLHIILGATMSSRLYNQVREKKGLAYEIGTSIRRFKDTGEFLVSAGVDNRKISTAVRLILKELFNFRKRPPAKSELKRAKEYFTGHFLMGLEDSVEHMLWLGEHVIAVNKVPDPKKILEKVQSVKTKDLIILADKIISKNNAYLAVVGPIKDDDKRELEELVYNDERRG